MKYNKLRKNLINIVKEAQIKLGYDSVGVGVNYMSSCLINLIDGANEANLYELLVDFCKESEEDFGEITIANIENGYRLNVPPKGVEYVQKDIKEDEFLVKFINQIRNPLGTIEDIIELFKSFSDDVHIEKTPNNPEFDYLIYFENGEPDEFWYCIDTEDLGITYHRFMKADYLEFGF